MRSLQKKKDLHELKISNPSKFIPEWDSYPERKKNGLISHWKKEIFTFQKSIDNRVDELRRRGEESDGQ